MRGGLKARSRYPGVEDGTRRTTFLRATHPYPSMPLHCLRTAVSTSVSKRDDDDEEEEEEEEEESLFKADAVNEEDSERDRATQV